MAMTIACLCSAFMGVYFEKVPKHSTNDGGHARVLVSMWIQIMQMVFFSICIAMMNIYRKYGDWGYTGEMHADNNPMPKPFMHSFMVWAWVIVAFQAGGGCLWWR